jgi:hypothetical protein
VTGRGFRERVVLKGVRVERSSAREPREAAGQLCSPPIEVVRPKLIDREKDHERRRSCRIRERAGRALRWAALRRKGRRDHERGGDAEWATNVNHVSKLARATARVTLM